MERVHIVRWDKLVRVKPNAYWADNPAYLGLGKGRRNRASIVGL